MGRLSRGRLRRRRRVELQSRNGRPLTRYFPELRFPPGPLRARRRDRRAAARFDTLGQRIHPAASRIAQLADETPATYFAFDLLARDDDVLLELPYDERRAALEALVAAPVELTPVVRTAAEAEHWLHDAEGVIAKDADAPYRPGERVGMVKVKRVRTIDAVVLGWRPGKAERTVGSLILGLYDDDGACTRSATRAGSARSEKRELVDKLAPYETGERGSGEPSRWNSGARARVGRAAPRARRRGHLRPRQRRAHPPRDEGPALARGQAPAARARSISSTAEPFGRRGSAFRVSPPDA